VAVELITKSDACLALRELGILVARRRGLNVDSFVDNFMSLLSNVDKADSPTTPVEQSDLLNDPIYAHHLHISKRTPSHSLRRFQSQPQLSSDTKRRRHFSFEPGEDHLHAMKEESTPTASSKSTHVSAPPRSSASANFSYTGLSPSSEGPRSPYRIPSLDPQDSSRIPTPVQPFGSLRRETSISSIQSTKYASSDARHNSQSSILTAFRENQNMALHRGLNSRSNSINDLYSTDASPSSTERPSSARIRTSVASLAVTRAGDHANHSVASKDGRRTRSKARKSTTGLSSQANCHMGPVESENDVPTRTVGA
jgi:hypothetical protein